MAVELRNRGALPIYRRHHPREDDQHHRKYRQGAALPFFWRRVWRRMPRWWRELLVVRLVGGLNIAFLPRSVVARIMRIEILFGCRILRHLRLIWLTRLTRCLCLGRCRAEIGHFATDVAKSLYR